MRNGRTTDGSTYGLIGRAVQSVIDATWGGHLCGRRNARAQRGPAGSSPRRAAVEPLEERRLLALAAGAYGPWSVDEGQPATFTLSASYDYGSYDKVISGWSVDWGDGASSSSPEWVPSGQQGYASATVSHYYGNGTTTHYVVATAYGEDDETASGTATLNVYDVPPTVTLNTGDTTPDEGDDYVVTFDGYSDPFDSVTQWTVDWGDGESSDTYNGAPAPGVTTLRHVYADGPSAFTVSSTVTMSDGSTAGTAWYVSVGEVAPDFDLAGPSHVSEGATWTIHHGYTDPGHDTVSSWIVDWGDGAGPVSVAGNPSTFKHVYADGDATHAAYFAASDEDGTYGMTRTVTVDNVAPGVSAGGLDYAVTGTPYTLALGQGTDPGQDTPWEWTVDWGDGSFQENWTPAAARAAEGREHTFGMSGTYTVVATLHDEDGSYSATCVVTAGPAPSLMIGGSASAIDEGGTLSLTYSLTPDTLNVTAWTVDWGQGAGWEAASPYGDLSHAYADGAAGGSTFEPRLRASLSNGQTLTATTTVTVNDVAPYAAFSGDGHGVEGSTVVAYLSYSDVAADPAAGWIVDWGDGNSMYPDSYAGTALTVTHTYADNNAPGTPYGVVAYAVNDDGTFSAGGLAVTIDNVTPTWSTDLPATALRGQTVTMRYADYLDPGTDTQSGWTVDWGDGGGPQGFTPGVGSFTHTYATDGTYYPGLFATDEDGTYGATYSIAIKHPPTTPVLTQPVAQTVGVGDYATLLAPFTDASPEDVHSATVNWGDGTTETLPAPLESGGNGSILANHVYSAASIYSASVTLTDLNDGTSAQRTVLFTVTNEGPAVTASDPIAATEGDQVYLSANFTDPNAFESHTAVIDWGDGTVEPAHVNDDRGSGEVWGTHVYVQDGVFNATVTVADGSEVEDDADVLVTVANAAPVADAGDFVQRLNFGGSLTLSGGFTDPGLLDTHTFAWVIVDAATNVTVATGTTQDLVFTPPAVGRYVATLTVADEDNATGTASTLIVALDPALPPDTTPLATPVGMAVATDDPDGVALTWTDTSDDKDGYYVEWSNDGEEYVMIALLPPGSTSYTDHSPDYNTDNSYRVHSFRGQIESSATNVVHADAITAPITFDDDNSGANGRGTLSPYKVVHDHTLTVHAGDGVLANDMDIAGVNFHVQPATYTQPANGHVTLDEDGGFIYEPDDHFVGIDYFTYYAEDDDGRVSLPARVAIDVTNAVPTSEIQVLNTSLSGSSGNDSLFGQLGGNDADPDETLTYEIVDDPAVGSVTVNEQTGEFVYNLPSGEWDSTYFTYIVKDSIPTQSEPRRVTIVHTTLPEEPEEPHTVPAEATPHPLPVTDEASRPAPTPQGVNEGLPATLEGVWAGYMQAKDKLAELLRKISDFGLSSAQIAQMQEANINESVMAAQDPMVDQIRQLFANYTRAAQVATRVAGDYMKTITFFWDYRKAAIDAVQSLPTTVSGIGPDRQQMQKWQGAMNHFHLGADWLMAESTFAVQAATETHKALEVAASAGGIASLTMTAGRVVAKKSCEAFLKFTYSQVVNQVRGAALNWAGGQLSQFAQAMGIPAEYVKIGGEALQAYYLIKAARNARAAAQSNCFVAGTEVLTGSSARPGVFSERPIEDVKVGDEVWSRDQYNPNAPPTLHRVLKTFKHIANDLQSVAIADGSGNVEVLHVTDEHPFYVPGRGFIDASHLLVGDRLSSPEGQVRTVTGNVDEKHAEGVWVYNFEVEGSHTYFVADGNGADAFTWVHNACYSGQSPDLTKPQVTGKPSSSKVLRDNLKSANVTDPAPGESAAHHIVAGNHPLAGAARTRLTLEGIDINSAANGVYLPRNAAVASPPTITHPLTDAYYNKVTELITNAPPGGVPAVLQQIRSDLLNGNKFW